jgi:hypothetical protein
LLEKKLQMPTQFIQDEDPATGEPGLFVEDKLQITMQFVQDEGP